MLVITADCRDRFSTRDLEFIAETLIGHKDQWDLFHGLFSETDSRNEILDDIRLFKSVLNSREQLDISKYFFFYTIIRRCFLENDLNDPDVADYVARVLSEFSNFQRVTNPVYKNKSYEYIVDMIEALRSPQSTQEEFVLTAHIANYSLFYAGVFPSRISRKVLKHAAPGMSYYDFTGETYFHRSSNHFLSIKYELKDLMKSISENFVQIRTSLNYAFNNYFVLN